MAQLLSSDYPKKDKAIPLLFVYGSASWAELDSNSTQVLHSPRLIHPFNPQPECRFVIASPANVPTWIHCPALIEPSPDSLSTAKSLSLLTASDVTGSGPKASFRKDSADHCTERWICLLRG